MTDLATIALELVRELRSEPGYNIVVRGGGPEIYRDVLKRDAVAVWSGNRAVECHAPRVQDLVRRAEGGNAYADAVLRDIAIDMIKESRPLPEKLGAYIVDVLLSVKFKRRRGRDGNEQKVRRRLIWEAVERGISRGLHVTRDRSTERVPSASSAVAEAYHMKEDAVYKVYEKERGATFESWKK